MKFKQNPQHRRILINEWIVSALFQSLGIGTPRTKLVVLTSEFLALNPQVKIQVSSRSRAVEPGVHFGSRFPVDPRKHALYDFVPDAFLQQCINLADFVGALIVDKWVGNSDSRQAIFFRARPSPLDFSSSHKRTHGWYAAMIDQGYAFGGPYWEFNDSPLQSLYFRPCVYANLRSFESIDFWINRIEELGDRRVWSIFESVPLEWYEGEARELNRLAELLLGRRQRLSDLVAAVFAARPLLAPQLAPPRLAPRSEDGKLPSRSLVR